LSDTWAGPCDDEDKICCLTERENERDSERKEIKMSPLKQVLLWLDLILRNLEGTADGV
jgi:hypothetical protein